MESKTVVKPKLTPDFPESVVQEGADESTLRVKSTRRRCIALFHRHHECGRQKMGVNARG